MGNGNARNENIIMSGKWQSVLFTVCRDRGSTRRGDNDNDFLPRPDDDQLLRLRYRKRSVGRTMVTDAATGGTVKMAVEVLIDERKSNR